VGILLNIGYHMRPIAMKQIATFDQTTLSGT